MPTPRAHRRLVLSIGSINADIAVYAHRLPRPGETLHAEHYAINLGGKGANQAAAAARLAAPLGLRAAFAGRIGADPFGALVHAQLAAFGAELQALRTDPANPTGLALIGIDDAGENAITVIGAANMALDASDIDAATPLLEEASVVLLQLEIPLAAVLQAATRARAAGALVVLDPAPVPPGGLPDALLASADILTPNETETEQLTGLRPHDPATAAHAARRLLDRGVPGAVIKLGASGVFYRFFGAEGFIEAFPVRSIDSVAAGDIFNAGLAIALTRGDDPATAAHAARRLLDRGVPGAVIKLGASGVFYRFFGAEGFIEAFPVRSIDSVAAGDIFNAGLAIALTRGDDPARAVRFAAACGALATTRRGAAHAAPTLDEVHALLA